MNTLNLSPWILVEDFSSVYNDVDAERGTVKHTHKKRKMADGREKTIVRITQMYTDGFARKRDCVFIYCVGVCMLVCVWDSRAQMMRKAWGRCVGDTSW